MDYPAEANDFQSTHAQLIQYSFRRLLGRNILPEVSCGNHFAKRLFHAPFAVLSHNAAADPIFNYGNLSALSLFEFSWDELCHLPSRLSAEASAQSDRARLLAEVKDKGYSENYQGVRISKTGRRFLIKASIVWNLIDEHGRVHGQAACLRQWEFL